MISDTKGADIITKDVLEGYFTSEKKEGFQRTNRGCQWVLRLNKR